VKLIELESGDKLQAIAPVIGEEKEDAAGEGEAKWFKRSLQIRSFLVA